ncbi:MAG TPA: ester cyclase [Candidatus Limnocylindrales bacterium]|nr:ester cyclase [Candidatus Limnocylindrales bacterium]
MTATTMRTMSVDETRATISRYLESGHSDLEIMAPDVCFTVMATGQEFRGPAAIAAMLTYFHQQAFHAEAINERLLVGEGRAVGEWDFVGRHTGEFAGVPATGKEVRVPLAVAYDLEDGKVVRGRVYFETPAFLAQVGALG